MMRYELSIIIIIIIIITNNKIFTCSTELDHETNDDILMCLN